MSNAYLLYFSEKTEIKLQFFFSIANPFIKNEILDDSHIKTQIFMKKWSYPKAAPLLG